jgi:hypothetical protein
MADSTLTRELNCVALAIGFQSMSLRARLPAHLPSQELLEQLQVLKGPLHQLPKCLLAPAQQRPASPPVGLPRVAGSMV